MQRYQPPHLRTRPQPPLISPSSHSAINALAGPSKPPNLPSTDQESYDHKFGASRTSPSQRDWSTPSTSVLSSPASDLKPMRRLLKLGVDEMDLLQSVSRSGGDGAEGDALKDFGVQQRYEAYINERLDKHHATFPRGRDDPPPANATNELESLGSIILLYRKLREGIAASHRVDSFAITVFEASARLAVLAHHSPQLLSALSGLVSGLYSTECTSFETSSNSDNLVNQLDGLKVSDNRIEFASLLLLYHLVATSPRSAYHATLMALTEPSHRSLRSPFSEATPTFPPARPFLPLSSLTYVIRASRALANETFDPIAYFALIQDHSVSRYERAVLSWAEDKVRERAWAMMQRAYLDVSLDWAGRLTGLNVGDVDGWLLGRSARIESGKVRMR